MDLGATLGAFPPTTLAFAYGSGVFAQRGYAPLPGTAPTPASPLTAKPGKAGDAPMVDFVFAVDDPVAWHAENLQRNRLHYSSLGLLGARGIAAVQATGARLWYNTLVPLPAAAGGAPGQKMKYGVISTADLLADLLEWQWLYVSGRMHKPVRLLHVERPPELLGAARENLRHALRAALLLLPASFTAGQLFSSVAALSYTGDWRMVVGENPHKVANIVAGNVRGFHELYTPILEAGFPTVHCEGAPASGAGSAEGAGAALSGASASGWSDDDLAALRFTQSTAPEARLSLGLSLPYRLQRLMAAALEAGGGAAALGVLAAPAAGAGEHGDASVAAGGSTRGAAASALSSAPGRLRAALSGLTPRGATEVLQGGSHRLLMERLRQQHQRVITSLPGRRARQHAKGSAGGVAAVGEGAGEGGTGERNVEEGAGAACSMGEGAGEGGTGERNVGSRLAARWVALKERRDALLAGAGAGRAEARRRSLSQLLARVQGSRYQPPAGRADGTDAVQRLTEAVAASRAALARLRQARLQTVASWRERLASRAGSEARAPPLQSSTAASTSGLQPALAALPSAYPGVAWTHERAPRLQELLQESDGSYPPALTRALRDPVVTAFWAGILAEAQAEAGSLQEDTSASPTRLVARHRAAEAALRPARVAPADVAAKAAVFLRPAIAHTVGAAARTQSLKGIATAGPVKAALYAADKLKKWARAVFK